MLALRLYRQQRLLSGQLNSQLAGLTLMMNSCTREHSCSKVWMTARCLAARASMASQDRTVISAPAEARDSKSKNSAAVRCKFQWSWSGGGQQEQTPGERSAPGGGHRQG